MWSKNTWHEIYPLTFLSTQHRVVNFVGTMWQKISRLYSSCVTVTWYSLNNPSFSLPPHPWQPLYSLLLWVWVSDTSSSGIMQYLSSVTDWLHLIFTLFMKEGMESTSSFTYPKHGFKNWKPGMAIIFISEFTVLKVWFCSQGRQVIGHYLLVFEKDCLSKGLQLCSSF